MELTEFKAKDFIKDREKLQEYECGICFDICINPVRCSGSCHKLFCIHCVSKAKNVADKCPNRCSQPFNVTKIPLFTISFNCPFSSLCKIPIDSLSQFTRHFTICLFTPKEELLRQGLKQKYKCSKSHHLQFYIGKFTEMISSICAECQEQKLCRSICRLCDQKYCVECRMPPCSKSACPVGHTFTLIQGKDVQYICDICGLDASILNTRIYDDKICNFGICEFCFNELPLKRDNSQLVKLINKHQECQCGSTLQFHKNADSSKICCLCQKCKECPKYCPQCNKYYCLKCKLVNIYQNICEFQHPFKQVKFQIQSEKGCMRCDKIKQKYFEDEACKLLLCEECMDQFSNITFDKQRIRPVFCDYGHKLLFIRNKSAFYDQCKCCKELRMIKLWCKYCQDKEQCYCLACKKISFEAKCLFDHPLEHKEDSSGKLRCDICLTFGTQMKHCKKCSFFVCQSCSLLGSINSSLIVSSQQKKLPTVST